MKKADIEYLILEISEEIYKRNKQLFDDKIMGNKDLEVLLSYLRFEREQIMTEVLFAIQEINGGESF